MNEDTAARQTAGSLPLQHLRQMASAKFLQSWESTVIRGILKSNVSCKREISGKSGAISYSDYVGVAV